jgi:HSP20 family protein
MAIVRLSDRPFYRNPWTEFEKMRREMDLLTRGLFNQRTGGERATVFPALVISEDEHTIYIEAEIAGVNPQDIEISVEGETLTIKGERKAAVEEKVSFHRREIEYGNFSRAVSLPARVNINQITARTVDGILYIDLPKAEEAKPKKVNVTVG